MQGPGVPRGVVALVESCAPWGLRQHPSWSWLGAGWLEGLGLWLGFM